MQDHMTLWPTVLQVLAMLGNIDNKRVVELGAGIGRFTGPLAASAKSVLAFDFMEHLIQENIKTNGDRCVMPMVTAFYVFLPPHSWDPLWNADCNGNKKGKKRGGEKKLRKDGRHTIPSSAGVLFVMPPSDVTGQRVTEHGVWAGAGAT